MFVALGGEKRLAHNGCEAPPYDACNDTCNPCSPCEPTCEPKTRAQDAIILELNEIERCFTIGYFRCTKQVFLANQHCFHMKIRRRGHCKELFSIDPVRATEEGAVCFSWLNIWDTVDSGYYEADLYIDCDVCNTLLFYVQPCDTIVTKSTATIATICPTSCGMCNNCCGTSPQIDIEPSTSTSSEDTCNTCEDTQ